MSNARLDDLLNQNYRRKQQQLQMTTDDAIHNGIKAKKIKTTSKGEGGRMKQLA